MVLKFVLIRKVYNQWFGNRWNMSLTEPMMTQISDACQDLKIQDSPGLLHEIMMGSVKCPFKIHTSYLHFSWL